MTLARLVGVIVGAIAPALAAAQSAPTDSAAALGHLRTLIRMNTVNPPGNEIAVATYLDSVLTAAGIKTWRFTPAPGRAALVARITGTGARKPIVLMGHMDVVGVHREQWVADPFAAELRGDTLYGRGAIDDKGMLVANLMAMLRLKREGDAGAVLQRDVIFIANSDEEAGGEFGMGWLIANHPDLIRGEFALNEGGRTRIIAGGRRYVALQGAEKVSHVVTVTARGPDGHASIPLDGNAIVRLGRALAAIGTHREPTVLTPTTTRFFGDLASSWPDRRVGRAMADVSSGVADRIAAGATVLRATPVFDAVLRNGISPTIVGGGIRSNVIPASATATLNVRTLPGESVDAVVERLRRTVNDSLVRIEVTSRGEESPAMPASGALFDAVRSAARAIDPAIIVVPYLSTGATDSARLRVWGMQAYGLLPFPLAQDDEDRMHGNNERLPLASLTFGVRFIYEIAARAAR
ncbi:MAG: M20/M25/M40 family metallo-hydrolase [Gemmatimonadaceae bacterium]|nr:M20/M25/M40 family metallo-hydrolase [Gemmatimonadaceae bacterium]